MMLIDPTHLRDPLGFDDMTDINEAIIAALEATTASLAAKLDTSFDAATTTHIWHVQQLLRNVGLLKHTELRLRNGFVTSLDSISYASDMAHFGTSDATSSLASVMLHGEKGMLVDLSTDYTGQFVKATYTHGFTEGAPDVFDPAEVPVWLQEAARLQAMIYLAQSPALQQADVTIDAATHQRGLDAIMHKHVRYTPLAEVPLT